jgi:hypothetical protein
LSVEQLRDPQILEAEARKCAERFIREGHRLSFFIGGSNWNTSRALVFTIRSRAVAVLWRPGRLDLSSP